VRSSERAWESTPKPVSTQSVPTAPVSESLANLWHATLRALRAVAGEVLCLVELRGFEPLTSCMPSSERLSKRSWSPSFALLITGLELYRYGPLVTVVVPSHILQTSSKLPARPHPSWRQRSPAQVIGEPPGRPPVSFARGGTPTPTPAGG